MGRAVTIAMLLGFWSAHAQAVPHTFKYDQFGESIQEAANDVNGQSLATQPGFVQGEAFGQVYRPDPAHYPVQISGIDLILAAPPNASGLTTHANIEIWNGPGSGADPGTGSPFFQISTTQVFNPDTGADGVPLQGNVGLSVDFDLNDPEGHPSVITSGNIWVMIRMTSASKSMETEWGTINCIIISGIGCGCQNVGTINDFSTTNQANVMHVVTPVGQCSGSQSWVYAEDAGVTGDFLIRMRADVASAACVPICDGAVCGADGCGGSCGSCESNEVCNSGTCQPFCLPDCAGKNCGDDGCGGTCGSCESTQTCLNGTCTGPSSCSPACDSDQTCTDGACVDNICTADCAGKNCGDDGCGGSCGTCTGGQTCSGTVCAGGTPGDLAILDISPNSGENGDYVDVAITGTGFVQGLDVLIAGTELPGVKVTGDTLIRAQVPPGLPVGPQTVTVANLDGKTATLTDGYTVLAAAAATCGDSVCDLANGENAAACPIDCATGPGTSSGCAADNSSSAPLSALGAIFALLAIIALRRRQQLARTRRVASRRDGNTYR